VNKYHEPALLKETIQGLDVKSDGVYVDVTFGGGGHSRSIMEQLSAQGKLFAFDQDPDAKRNLWEDDRLVFIPQNFIYLKNFLRINQAIPVDGILADFGVSFHQFDEADRGFSFRFDGPLDMRMDQKRELTAAKVVNEYSVEELERVLKNYGELRDAKRVARKIEQERAQVDLKTIGQFKKALSRLVPEKQEHKFLAQVFQALRIEVNEELKVIEVFLEQSLEVLKEGGRLVVITYHSLEDRLVKNFFKSGNFRGELEKDFYGNVIRPFVAINRKPIVPTSSEIQLNNRSRSAKLRIAKKVA
tara:strand:+ start:4881 stop:5786 length:906 start_codon:yes stop_codon:yes gene_type:complete